MTQDHGPGYVVRGEVIADDDTGEVPAEQAGPMTRFEKVASALRDDRPEPSAPEAAGNGSADAASDEEARSDEARSDEVGPDEVGPDEVGAVRSPDAGGHDDWDDEEEPAEDRDQADGATGPHEATVPSATVPAAAEPAAAETAAAEPAAPEPADAEPAAAETAAAEPADPEKHAGAPAEPELRPGEADAGPGDPTYGNVLPDASEFRERWQQVQFMFVDDPHGSVTEAADIIAQVTAKLEAAIAERQRSLRGRWDDGANADTETLRATLLMYRAFLDQLTS